MMLSALMDAQSAILRQNNYSIFGESRKQDALLWLHQWENLMISVYKVNIGFYTNGPQFTLLHFFFG